jgi:hypothetical protein
LAVTAAAGRPFGANVWHGLALDDCARRPYLAGSAPGRCADMTTFDDREKGFETKFARDEEMAFRIVARRNRLLGEWAARLMGLTEVEGEAYAKEIIRAEFEEAGDEDVIRKLLGDLTAANVEIDESAIRSTMAHKEVDARRQLMESK